MVVEAVAAEGGEEPPVWGGEGCRGRGVAADRNDGVGVGPPVWRAGAEPQGAPHVEARAVEQ